MGLPYAYQIRVSQVRLKSDRPDADKDEGVARFPRELDECGYPRACRGLPFQVERRPPLASGRAVDGSSGQEWRG
jgi:hypothetical protein